MLVTTDSDASICLLLTVQLRFQCALIKINLELQINRTASCSYIAKIIQALCVKISYFIPVNSL